MDNDLKNLQAVKEFADNQESYSCKTNVEVYENGQLKWTYHAVYVSCYYVHAYGDYAVEIVWEDDSEEEEDCKYKDRGLHGKYSTNFQKMNYKACTLQIADGSFDIYIHKNN